MDPLDDVMVTLSKDQALVLSDWLHRQMASPMFADFVDDRAVWSPLLHLSGSLEQQLVEIFSPNYASVVDRARANLLLRLGDFGVSGTVDGADE